MKELSIEQKAKAYDNVRKKIAIRFGSNIVKEIFSEYEESEDERIRKAIGYAIGQSTHSDGTLINGVSSEEALAWLEKQDNNMGISEATKHELEDNLNKTLEKETPESWNEFLEKSSEQRSIDKAEPKFKVGDWVIFNENHNSVYQVEKIDNYRYYLRHYLGGTLSVHFDNELIREWNINDAKAGDVLAAHECLVLFKEIDGLNIRCYCTYHYMGSNPRLYVDTLQNKTAFYPATKEQHDTLEGAITNAGYEWDAEKKELKKIEEKKDIHNKLTAFEFSLKHIIEEAIECGDIHNLKADADILLRIARKTSWSEEDECILLRIIDDLKFLKDTVSTDPSYAINIIDMERRINFLESIKDRVNPKQKWKQENIGDLTDFENAMMHIGNSFFGDNAGLDPNDTNAIIEQANLLLELVPKQEWSEEDKRTYKSITYSFANNYPLTVQQQEFVKSLKERYVWKPSDEQMDALNDVISSRDIKYDVLSELWKDLKKLKG